MKGITPVIAIILLLLITISMVGFAFVWFSRMTTQTTTDISNQVSNQTDQTAKKAVIDSAGSGNVYVRNSGSKNLNLGTEVTVYVNNVLVTTCGWSGTLAPGALATCQTNAPGPVCTIGATAKVTTPGFTDTATCQ